MVRFDTNEIHRIVKVRIGMKFGIRPSDVGKWSLAEVSDVLEVMRADDKYQEMKASKG